jgi:hypothetical protein
MFYRKIFHHKQTYYDEFLYIWVIIFVLYQILASLSDLIPVARESYYLSWALYLYPITLLSMAVKAITKLKVWQAIMTVVLSIILTLSFLACMPAFILSMIGAVPRVL